MEISRAGGRGITCKPIASRPTCSNFGSFSELLACAIEENSPYTSYEPTVPAIRPKTLRIKPFPKCAEFKTVPPQESVPATDVCSFPTCEDKPTVIYKPLAKHVSNTTVSFVENPYIGSKVEDDCILRHQRAAAPAHMDDRAGYKHGVSSSMEACRAPTGGSEPGMDHLRRAPTGQDDGGDHRPSYDGYNWRKYGQKQVKGSEYPRSYYKCTHPNCPVKKKVERSLEGHIAEIVYKGEHTHTKPLPRRAPPASRGAQAAAPVDEPVLPHRPVCPETTPGFDNSDYSCCCVPGEGLGEGSKEAVTEEEPKSKRRKTDKEGDTVGEVFQEARVVMQGSSAETEVFEDGFRWRKYGQKVVKGNPYPRSYYRCTYAKCKVRKHVERASNDPNAFITTYEGKHNHGESCLKAAAPDTTLPASALQVPPPTCD